jgi:hypothetical protein
MATPTHRTVSIVGVAVQGAVRLTESQLPLAGITVTWGLATHRENILFYSKEPLDPLEIRP